MKIRLLAVCVLATGLLDAQPQSCSLSDHTRWVESSLSAIRAVKVGMTRADLQRLFTEEGGIATASQRTYVFRECPYIKVDVLFALTEQDGRERPIDRVVEISKPYLEWPHGD
jgi:hypothetical protein